MLRKLATMGLICLLSSPTTAQKIDVDALKATIGKASDSYAELRPLLSDPNESKRIAAFEAFVAHGDKGLYEIAVSSAIADGSEVLRARALWEIMSRRDLITIAFDMEAINKNETLQQNFSKAKMPAQFVWKVLKRFPETQCLSMQHSTNCHPSSSWTISGLTAAFKHGSSNTSGQFELMDDGRLLGEVTWKYHEQTANFPAIVIIR